MSTEKKQAVELAAELLKIQSELILTHANSMEQLLYANNLPSTMTSRWVKADLKQIKAARELGYLMLKAAELELENYEETQT